MKESGSLLRAYVQKQNSCAWLHIECSYFIRASDSKMQTQLHIKSENVELFWFYSFS